MGEKCIVKDVREGDLFGRWVRTKTDIRNKPYMILCTDRAMVWDKFSSKKEAQKLANKLNKNKITT